MARKYTAESDFGKHIRSLDISALKWNFPPVRRFTREEVAALAAAKGVSPHPDAGKPFEAGVILSPSAGLIKLDKARASFIPPWIAKRKEAA